MTKPRVTFKEAKGGRIINHNGLVVCTVNVEGMLTNEARVVVRLIIEALDREFGAEAPHD